MAIGHRHAFHRLARHADRITRLEVDRRAWLTDHRYFRDARSAATAATATSQMDNVDVDLPVVLNVDAVINLVDDLVMTTIDVVDYIAFVAVDIAKI